jgi:uncharacterized protein (TIGR02453 family)
LNGIATYKLGGNEMVNFNRKFLDFFRKLSQNNNKVWFDKNRSTYETEVKAPFKELVNEMILRINQEDPDLDIEAKDAIFRINRDIRFSKDKTPYKTNVSANIARGGRKSHNVPGFYIHFGFDSAVIAGGVHAPDKEGLYKIRAKIAKSPDEFSRLLEDPDFKESFGTILGEKNKRIPKEFESSAASQPLIANKQFFYWAELEPEFVIKPNLPDLLMEYFHAGKGVSDFLNEALNS